MIATSLSSMPMFSMKRKSGYDNSDEEDRIYTCKTCNKDFSSFQALGGHRAGHNNRIKNDADMANKSHTCQYCFEKFVSGQALGGHMRKHRDIMEEKAKPYSLKKSKNTESFQEDEKLQLSDSDLDLVLRIEPIRSISPGSPSSEVLDMESGKENKSLQLVESDRESDPVRKDDYVGEECSYALKVVYIDFFSKKYDQVEEDLPVEIVPVLEDDDSLLELRMGY